MTTDTLEPRSSKRTRHRAEDPTTLLRIQSEYHEMPGLALTEAQVQRLWNLDQEACGAVLATLTRRGILKRTSRGTYVRGPV